MSATAEVTWGADQKARASGGASLGTRVRTRLHRHKLDKELASGADPNINSLRYERARELVGEQNRRRIAASLEQLLGEADSSPRAFTSRVPIARAAIRDSRGSLDTIVELLRTPAYISAQGVARISLLLSDGAGPLYGNNPAHSEELRRALETVVDTIDQSTP
jgi:hypothetical protein